MFPNPNGMFNQQMYNPSQNYGTCRVCQVSSLAEVQSCIVPLDGQVTYFPCTAENCIYTKIIGNNGVPSIQKFTPVPVVENSANSFTDMVTRLEERVAKLEGVIGNVQFNANAGTDANVQTKSPANTK